MSKPSQMEAPEKINSSLYPKPAPPVTVDPGTYELFVGRAKKSSRQVGDPKATEDDFAQGIDSE